MKIIATCLVVLFLAMPAMAADFSGKWTGSVATQGGELPVSFSFKTEGDKTSGTMAGPDGSDSPLEALKVDGNNISFNVTLNFNGNSFTLSYKGVLADNQIKFSSDFNGQSFEFVVKKAG